MSQPTVVSVPKQESSPSAGQNESFNMFPQLQPTKKTNVEPGVIPPEVIAKICRDCTLDDEPRLKTISAMLFSNSTYVSIFISLYIGLNPLLHLVEDEIPAKIQDLVTDVRKAVDYVMGIFRECPTLLTYLGNEELMVYLFNKYNSSSEEDTELTEEDTEKITQMTTLGFTIEEATEAYLEYQRNAEVALSVLFARRFGE